MGNWRKHDKVYLSSRPCTEFIAKLAIKKNQVTTISSPIFSHSLPWCLISLLLSFPSVVFLLFYPFFQQVLSLKVGFVSQNLDLIPKHSFSVILHSHAASPASLLHANARNFHRKTPSYFRDLAVILMSPAFFLWPIIVLAFNFVL